MTKIDVVGDVHGQLPALKQLGKSLGYAVDDGWTHRDERALVFIGDLIDRGAHSLEVGELVMGLVQQGRAICLMGNHEYNLVAHWLQVAGYEKAKESNQVTVADVRSRFERWGPVLRFFRGLPMSLELGDLRIAHASWHKPSLEQVDGMLDQPSCPPSLPETGAAAPLGASVRHFSPFTEVGPVDGLPDRPSEEIDPPHEILMKGFEVPCSGFFDTGGKWRTLMRVKWWLPESSDAVLTDKATVFGHYWNLPPLDGDFVPGQRHGRAVAGAWAAGFLRDHPELSEVGASGRTTLRGDFACVDFNGVTAASGKSTACVGALRWPEREICWATGAWTGE